MAWNRGFDYRERLGADADGVTVVAYLTRRYRHSDEAAWRARAEAGRLRVDGRPVHPDAVLRRGGILVWRRPPWNEPEAPACFAVLYRDDDLLGVAKPSGLPTLPGGGFLESTLLRLVRRRYPEASPLHRLGRGTSGVVLFARTDLARLRLSRSWAAGAVDKRYRALASGDPVWSSRVVTDPIGRVPHPTLGSVHAVAIGGKPSTTRVEVLERRADAFLCDVAIATGRPHQIRIHLAAAGHPLVGDPLYVAGSGPAPDSSAVPGDTGYLLHAAELTFDHPRESRRVTIACAPPPALRRGDIPRNVRIR